MGAKPSENSIRARLARLQPSKPEVFMTPEGRTYNSLMREIAAGLSRHFPDRAIDVSQRKALLVFDEAQPPIACSVVTWTPRTA